MIQEPKKPMNAYLLFLDEKKSKFVREAGGDYKKGISLASKAWREISLEDNQYVQKAKDLKDKYNEDLQSFLRASGDTKVKENGLKIERLPLPVKARMKRMKIERATNGEPKKPLNPYFLFVQEKKEQFIAEADGNYKTGISLAASAYKELSDDAKQPFESKAKEMRDQYEKDMQAFLDAGGTKKPRSRKANDKKPRTKKPRQEETGETEVRVRRNQNANVGKVGKRIKTNESHKTALQQIRTIATAALRKSGA